FLLGVLRERPPHADRARELPARARNDPRLPRRARARFLRALLGRGRAQVRVAGGGGRGWLPRHRRPRLDGTDARELRGARRRLRPISGARLTNWSTESPVPFAARPR